MKWCHIFTTGIHTDSKGREHNWTQQDLETIKKNFDDKKLDAPIAVGHIQSSSPAYGWVEALKIKGNNLYAAFKDVQEEFKQAYNKGLFKGRSISLDKDLNLRHIAFLGAKAPAVKGLEQFCFQNSDDDFVIDFESEEELDYKETESGKIERKSMNIEEELEQARMECAKKNDRIKILEDALKKEQQEKQNKDFEDFCDLAIKEGKIKPCQKEKVYNILQNLNSNFEFSEADSGDLVKQFKDFVSDIKQIDMGEVALKNKVGQYPEFNFEDANDVKEAILQIQNDYIKKGITLNTLQALSKLKGDH